MKTKETLDTMVRDFTRIPPPSKSEVRRRIKEYVEDRLDEVVPENINTLTGWRSCRQEVLDKINQIKKTL